MITHESMRQLYIDACELGEALPRITAAIDSSPIREDLAPLIAAIADLQHATARLTALLHSTRPEAWQRIVDEVRAAKES